MLPLKLSQRVKHHIVRHPNLSVDVFFAPRFAPALGPWAQGKFVAFLIRHNLDANIGDFAKLPNKISAVIPLGKVFGPFDSQAEQHIGNDWVTLQLVKNPHIGFGNKGQRDSLGTVERVNQQPLLLGRLEVIHGGIVFNHKMAGIDRRDDALRMLV